MRRLNEMLEEVIASRKGLPANVVEDRKAAEEGGCGVTGFISNIPISGRHIFEPSVQMHNRGNGKGGGIAAVGLAPKTLGVTQNVLDTHYLLQIALLDSKVGPAVEQEYVTPYLEVNQAGRIPTIDDFHDVKGLEIRPPDVMRYFVRVKKNILDRFIEKNKLRDMDPRQAEDEFIYQNSFRLNQKYYASMGEKQAFVLSHGRNLMILKIVGYAELVAKYYLLDNFKAHGWIAHQRYPTKGRVWHPGGAHPFIGLDEALVHNGDFANYHSITEYLKQYNIRPQFLTDTEVSVQLFDLWNRNFGYPLEYIIEAMAPTTEYDFDQLPPEKQRIYRSIQQNHMHSSPDGPWFFIIARNDVYHQQLQLIGITDTAMLRPQVFAIQDGEVQIGLICSEKQAIDATLKSLASEDPRFCPVADHYWNARGGSATDGGAFIFDVKDAGKGNGQKILTCTNKFGEVISFPGSEGKSSPVSFQKLLKSSRTHGIPEFQGEPAHIQNVSSGIEDGVASALYSDVNADITSLKEEARRMLVEGDHAQFQRFCLELVMSSTTDDGVKSRIIETLTYLNDTHLPTGMKKRSWTLNVIRDSLTAIFNSVALVNKKNVPDSLYCRIDWKTHKALRAPRGKEKIMVIDASQFPPEGDDCDARLIVGAYQLGWKVFIAYGYRGQRFCGCGLAQNSQGIRLDVYGSSGDYLSSGIDGMEIYVHGNAQDQVGQILKSGKLVIYGDVGQTFMYGAKGGEVYVMGNAAGRPLINAVGHPRIVINGTCLDYLAESFMAGDPLNGGGFVIMNGIAFDNDGNLKSLNSPYPGSNLFSLASGGAIYLRDPENKVSREQLNGGEFVKLAQKDWKLILPYLQENERLFGVKVSDLLTINGVKREPSEVYRKVQVVQLDVLAAKAPAKPSPKSYAGVIPEGEDADE
jgi:glutamate synthase domain-containing protein 1/glutamate synthase domain-containing protein 3